MRDIQKAIEEGYKIRHERERLDLRASELDKIARKAIGCGVNGLFDAIIDAYSAGLAIGLRNQSCEVVKFPEAGQA